MPYRTFSLSFLLDGVAESTVSDISSDFLARDSIYAIARSLLTPVRPPVCPPVPLSVCHTGGSVKDG